jgi:hypothetical protein
VGWGEAGRGWAALERSVSYFSQTANSGRRGAWLHLGGVARQRRVRCVLGRGSDVSCAHLGWAGKGWCRSWRGILSAQLRRPRRRWAKPSRSAVATSDLSCGLGSEGRPLVVSQLRKGGDTNFWRLPCGRKTPPRVGKGPLRNLWGWENLLGNVRLFADTHPG